MTTAQTLRSGLADRVRTPLYRNGYALVASSLTTSALGFVYWLIAARSYSPEAVGVGAALIAATVLMADLSQLNLKSAINRFLPRSGRRTAATLLVAYAAAGTLAIVAATIFVVGVEVWSPETLFLARRPEIAAVFVIGAVGWTLFVLQDSALVGIREAAWVPVENTVYAVGKIVALVLMVGAFPLLGVYLSWIVLLPLLLVAVNVPLFVRLIPRHVSRTGPDPAPIGRRDIAAYLGGDWLAFAVWSGTAGVLPILVLSVSGAEATAFYFIAWSIGYALYIVTSGMGQSLITEASLDEEALLDLARRTVIESARVVVPGAALLVVGAPWILQLMGDDYSGSASNLLRLIALSAIPYIVVGTAANVARVRRRMGQVVAIYTTIAVVVLGLSSLLLEPMGITGVGVAWLMGQSLVAMVVLAPYVARHAVRVAPASWLGAAGRVRDAATSRSRAKSARAAAGRALAQLADGDWRLARLLVSDGAVGVSRVRTAAGDSAILKTARVPEGRDAIRRSCSVLEELHADGRLDGWSEVVPRLRRLSDDAEETVALEDDLAGDELATLLRGGSADRALESALEAIGELHRRTATTMLIGARELDTVLGDAFEGLDGLTGGGRAATLRRLREEIGEPLRGSRRALARVHGDYAPRNILLAGAGERVVGIVDWEASRSEQFPELDTIHLALTTTAIASRRELGQVVAALLTGAGPPARTPVPVRESLAACDTGAWRSLLLLTWLHHVSVNARKAATYESGSPWYVRNVEPVLDALGSGAPASSAIGGPQAPG